MRRIGVLLIAVVFLLCGCAKEEKPLTLMVATDIHYLSPELHDGGELITKVVENGDNKMVFEMPEVIDAFIEEVLKVKPSALILSGDLSFNGELLSHKGLGEKLQKVWDAGIPVLVLPGNHDLNYAYAFRYEGDESYETETTTQAQFREIYGGFGYQDALSQDKETLSFVYPVSETLQLLFLDANGEGMGGTVPEETLVWAKEQLEAAKAAGAQVITVTHQNVIGNRFGYIINNNSKVQELFASYEVPLNLSGHIHKQGIENLEGLYDVEGNSLAVFPNQYGIVTVDNDGAISYEAKTVRDFMPEEFGAASQARFDASSRAMAESIMEELTLSEEDATAMIEWLIEVNRAYFAGRLEEHPELSTESEGYALWERYGSETRTWRYITGMFAEGILPGAHLKIPAITE